MSRASKARGKQALAEVLGGCLLEVGLPGVPPSENPVVTESLQTSADGAALSTSDIQVASFIQGQSSTSVGAAHTVASGQANESPTWSRDGATLSFTKYDGDAGSGDVWTVPADGSAPAAVTVATAGDELTVATGAYDSVPPGAVAANQAFTLSGTAVTLRWTLPNDTDLSGVTVTRISTTTNAANKTFFVPAPLASFVDTGLTIGQNYTYTFAASDRSGSNSALANRSMTAASALATFADPTSMTTTRAPFPVRFSPAAPASVLFTVDYRINGGGYRNWVPGKSGATRTFGAASTGANATASTPGQTYQFRASAVDGFGNTTGQALSGRAAVPFDQTKATLSGGVNAARSDSWLGTVRTLNAAGQYARIAITGDRVQIIGERCPTCGAFDVYDGSTRIAAIDSRASARQVLYTRTWGAIGNHTLTIKPRGTVGRPNVVLDGFAVRH